MEFMGLQLQRWVRSSAISASLALALLAGCGDDGDKSLPMSISITPGTATVNAGLTQSFSANVLNATDSTVSWSVQEGAAGGAISAAGLYLAPIATGIYHVVATSHADPSKTARASVTVTSAVAITISPASVQISLTNVAPPPVTFIAAVTNAANTAVDWSVQEGAAGGAITAGGVYQAPSAIGTYHVLATSQADKSKKATAVITVASQPNFSSTPPTAANEGDAYSYLASAVDPSGGTVIISLDESPAGASFSNGILEWTPTAEQSRKPNSFTLTATSSLGGVQQQSWTVTPTGIVQVTNVVKYLTAQGPQLIPTDTSIVVNALVPDGDGGFNTLEAVQQDSGRYTLSMVPAGYYWLQYNGTYLWTSGSAIDLGFALQGRVELFYALPGSSVSLRLTNLQSWESPDLISFVSPNAAYAQDWNFPDAEEDGQVTTTMLMDWSYNPIIDEAQGDLSYASQMVAKDFDDQEFNVLVKSTGPLPVTVADGAITAIPAPMVNVPQTGNLTGNINGSSFAALEKAMSPRAVPDSTDLYVGVVSFGSDELIANYQPQLLLKSSTDPIETDLKLDPIHFGNPFPKSWTPFLSYTHSITAPYDLPGASQPLTILAAQSQATTTLPTGSQPILPAIGPVIAATVNGGDFFQDQASVSAPLTLTWMAPTVGTATAYRITVYHLTGDSSGNWNSTGVADLLTTLTMVVVPPDVLVAGEKYVFKISAIQSPVDLVTQPYRRVMPEAYAEALSGVISPVVVPTPSIAKSAGVKPRLVSAQPLSTRRAMQNGLSARRVLHATGTSRAR